MYCPDGMPAGRTWAGDAQSYTKDVISNAEKVGIDVYGIGICDSNVADYYKKNVVVDRVEDLARTILTVVDRSI